MSGPFFTGEGGAFPPAHTYFGGEELFPPTNPDSEYPMYPMATNGYVARANQRPFLEAAAAELNVIHGDGTFVVGLHEEQTDLLGGELQTGDSRIVVAGGYTEQPGTDLKEFWAVVSRLRAEAATEA